MWGHTSHSFHLSSSCIVTVNLHARGKKWSSLVNIRLYGFSLLVLQHFVTEFSENIWGKLKWLSTRVVYHHKSEKKLHTKHQLQYSYKSNQILTFCHYRFNTREYDYSTIHRTENVIGEIYRHILFDEMIPDLNKRPSLFDMSWWHFQHCKDRNYPNGTFKCTENGESFLILNQTYHFHPG